LNTGEKGKKIFEKGEKERGKRDERTERRGREHLDLRLTVIFRIAIKP